MSDTGLTDPLLLALAVVVYLILGFLRQKGSTSRIVAAIAGAVVVATGLVPGLVIPGMIGMLAGLATYGSAIVGVAVGLSYVSFRARDRTPMQRYLVSAAGAVMFVAGTTMGTTNWIIGIGAAITAIALLGPATQTRNGQDPGNKPQG